MTEKIKVNLENWSGKEEEVIINREKLTFSVYDHTFELVDVSVTDEDGDRFESFDIFLVENGKRNEFRTGYVCRFAWDKDQSWEAFQSEMMSRRDDNMFIAAAKLVANLY